jgi:predicted DNA-binding antitoxin AbrB/MazE fold protein
MSVSPVEYLKLTCSDELVSRLTGMIRPLVLESRNKEQLMSTRIEAIYEGGVFKPVSPPKDIAENSKVLLTVEPAFSIEQFRGLVKIDPADAAEIIDNAGS